MAIQYLATQTASEFHADSSFVRLMLGPVGCGKSVADCEEVFKLAWLQEPGDDGVRRSRWGIIRNTYPELKSTTIKTWLDWFPEEHFGKMKWDSPITHRILLPNFDLEVIFLALDSEQDVKKLMSFEFTGIYINELQFIHPKVFKICQQRVNRYPSKKSGAKITWAGVIADTNPPPTRHWIYKLFEKNKPNNFKIFKFKPALKIVNETPKDETPYAISLDGTIYINNPDADYINNLPDKNYYLNQVPSSTDEEIKVYFLGEYGVVVNGRPVHPEYKDRLHYADKELRADPNIELGLGWDFGLTPACAIIQYTPYGQFLVLDELYSEDDCLEDFVENSVIPHLDRHYPFWRDNYKSVHDPAGQGENQIDKKTCQETLAKFGIKSYPAASSNASVPRRNGLKYHLRKLSRGEPCFLVSSRCQQIREGLMGQFQYPKIKAVNDSLDDRYHEKPLKNMFSHICEALEYIGMQYVPASEDDRKTAKNDMLSKFARYNSQLQDIRRRAYGR